MFDDLLKTLQKQLHSIETESKGETRKMPINDVDDKIMTYGAMTVELAEKLDFNDEQLSTAVGLSVLALFSARGINHSKVGFAGREVDIWVGKNEQEADRIRSVIRDKVDEIAQRLQEKEKNNEDEAKFDA